MNEQVHRNRTIIVDVQRKDQRQKSSHKRFKHRHHQNQNDIDNRPLPLEMRPVIDAILSYGRKMNALGELGVAEIIDEVSSSLKSLNEIKNDNVICDLIVDLDEKSRIIREKFKSAYDEEIVSQEHVIEALKMGTEDIKNAGG